MKYKVINPFKVGQRLFTFGAVIEIKPGKEARLLELGKIKPLERELPQDIEDLADSNDQAQAVQAEPDGQALTRDDDALLSGKCAYRLWSELLQCHIWLVANQEAKVKLQTQGVTEAVYTVSEAEKLISLPDRQRAFVHTWKAGLNGTIETESATLELGPQKPHRDKDGALPPERTTSLREAYKVDRPFTFQGRHYKPGDVVFLTEKEVEPLFKLSTKWLKKARTRSSSGS